MECTHCNTELIQTDSWGSRDYILHGDQSGKRGDIFKCPSAEGFETEELALAYLEESGESFESLGITSWEEVVCYSSTSYVSGGFYTDGNNLKEGYPC